MTKFYDEFIRTTVAHNPDEIDAWASKIRSIQYGTGRDNTFSVGLVYNSGSLRVCVGPQCLVYEKLPRSEVPKPLVRFLIDDMYTFVGTNVESDLEDLASDYRICRWDINGVDLGSVAATLYAMKRFKGGASLKQLVSLVLDTTVELSDNFRRTLGKEEEVEIRENLVKAKDAMSDLEGEIDYLSELITAANLDQREGNPSWRRLTSAKLEYDCITAFVHFSLGEFLQASHYDTEHVFVFV